MANVVLSTGEASPSDVKLAFGTGIDGSAFGDIGPVSLVVPLGSATGKASGTGSLGTVSLSVPVGAAHGNGTGSGAIVSGGVGDIDLVTPTGSATGKANTTGALATVTMVVPAMTATGRAHVAAGIATVTLVAPSASALAQTVQKAGGLLPITVFSPPQGYAVVYRKGGVRSAILNPESTATTSVLPQTWSYTTFVDLE